MIIKNIYREDSFLISYKPFQKLLIDRGIKKQDLLKLAGISWGTMARLNTNQYVSLEVIDKLCSALDCQPGDLIEFIGK
jgi:DNA-binding Xre family transcriptional regulator